MAKKVQNRQYVNGEIILFEGVIDYNSRMKKIKMGSFWRPISFTTDRRRWVFATVLVAVLLVALLFANDRMEHISTIIDWLEEGYYVIADRYVYSNIAYQCAKLSEEGEKESLKNWILDFEFHRNALPMPDKTLFLSVPLSFIKKSLSETRTGDDRDYLNGKEDIHEKSLSFQENVYKEYLKLLDSREDFGKVDCFDAGGCFLPKEEIHAKIWETLVAE